MRRVIGDCPLGSKCEEVAEINGEQVMAICPWYIKMQGIDASGIEHDEHKCAISWMPFLQVEASGVNRGQTAAIESLRNVVSGATNRRIGYE